MTYARAPLRQVTTIVGLAGIAEIHVVNLPGNFSEARYLSWGYLSIVVACGLLIEKLAPSPSRLDYLAAAA